MYQLDPVNNIEIVSINARTLDDALFNSIKTIGQAIDMNPEADLLINENKKRLDSISLSNSITKSPRLLILEWIDPLYIAAGWNAELISKAGGINSEVTGKIECEELFKTDVADIIVIALCGLDINRSAKELSKILLDNPKQLELWKMQSAVKNSRVYIADGNLMFSRPTIRLLDALNWLKEIVIDFQNQTDVSSAGFSVKWDLNQLGKKEVGKENQRLLDIEEAHQSACDKHEISYIDPETGYKVLTGWFLKERKVFPFNFHQLNKIIKKDLLWNGMSSLPLWTCQRR